MAHYFYLARCADGSLYAGTCVDLHARERKHNDGTGAKYTRGRGPVRILYHEAFSTLNEARKREAEVKKLSKERKEKLCGDYAGIISTLSSAQIPSEASSEA